MNTPTFPTTESIDARNLPIIELPLCKAIRYPKIAVLDLFRGLRDVEPDLSICEFKAAYRVSDSVGRWIESRLEIAQ